jgi:hypothetical protein
LLTRTATRAGVSISCNSLRFDDPLRVGRALRQLHDRVPFAWLSPSVRY